MEEIIDLTPFITLDILKCKQKMREEMEHTPE